MMWMNSLWNFIASSASLGTLIGCGAVAVAVLTPPIIAAVIPNLRTTAIMVAVAAFSFTAVAGKFYHDGLSVKQAQWDASVGKEAGDGEAARDDAVRTLGPQPSDRGMFDDDGFNRDRRAK